MYFVMPQKKARRLNLSCIRLRKSVDGERGRETVCVYVCVLANVVGNGKLIRFQYSGGPFVAMHNVIMPIFATNSKWGIGIFVCDDNKRVEGIFDLSTKDIRKCDHFYQGNRIVMSDLFAQCQECATEMPATSSVASDF